MRTKAAVLYEMGRNAPYSETRPLVIDDIELEAPGSREVLVEVAAAGLCHSDLSVIDGSRPRVMPMVLGHEASGIVREVGADINDLAVGDHVVFSFVPVCSGCEYCLAGRAALCEKGAKANVAGTLLSGERRFIDQNGDRFNHHLGVSGFSQFTVASRESLVKIDNTLSLQTAALFGCAVLTGVGAVLNTAVVKAGSSVAVFGLGGVGLSSIMGAKYAKAFPIIAVDRVKEKLDLALKMGATHTIDASATDAVEAVREITSGGADHVFESVGNEQVLIQAYNATRRGGMTVTIGLPHPERMFSIPAFSITAEERTIKGSYMGSCIPSRDIPKYIELYQNGELPVDALGTHSITLDQINEGFDRLAQGKAVRQIVTF
ncbi:MAG: zinc-dependent alcohol dehydrogenase family protein [Acidobacteria bacterium]|nr:zinc-dependent alcohol dehydrogenase family protein [Acidobacteriota bacterium]